MSGSAGSVLDWLVGLIPGEASSLWPIGLVGSTGALLTSIVALAVAGLSGWYSHKSARDVERLRHTNEELERLRGATGALRLKLFLYTRSVVRRLSFYYDDRPDHPYPVHAVLPAEESAYHDGGLLIFRLLRPLTVSDIIEQQTFYADLALEPAMVDLLRFSHAAVEMLSGELLGEGFGKDEILPGFDMKRCGNSELGWPQPGSPFQRVRASYLRTAAAELVVSEQGSRPRQRCMAQAEFIHAWEHPAECGDFHAALMPIKALIDRFNPKSNPVFWLRLVGYAYVCKWFHDEVRKAAAHEHADVTALKLLVPAMLEVAEPPRVPGGFEAEQSLQAVQGRYLAEHAGKYEKRFEKIIHDAF